MPTVTECELSFWQLPVTSQNEKLHKFIATQFGLDIPTVAVCEGHDAPFDFVADAYCEREPSQIIMANRTGGKTIDVAALTVAEMVTKANCGVVVVAGSLAQAKRGYNYTRGFWYPYFAGDLVSDPTQSETRLKNGASLEVLAGSERSVHSPHVPKLRMDEIELMKPEVYQGALSIPLSMPGCKAHTLKTSTRFKLYGQMHQAWEDAPNCGIRRYRWCVWETIQRCTDECAGCVLADDCQGKARKAAGYMPVEDVRQKCRELDDETWHTQWLCDKPSKEGLVYAEFDENVHVYDGPAPAGTEYGCVDWGYTNPFVYLRVVVTPSDDVFVTREFYITQREVSSIAADLKAQVNPERVYCDPSGATERAELKKVGLPAYGRGSKVDEGIPLVRKGLETRKLHIHRSCTHLIADLNTYHYKEGTDRPEKDEGDHGPDALRYFYICKYPAKSRQVHSH